jgi:hypothetical protein
MHKIEPGVVDGKGRRNPETDALIISHADVPDWLPSVVGRGG